MVYVLESVEYFHFFQSTSPVYPIMWSTSSDDHAEGFAVASGAGDEIGELVTADEWNSVIVDKDAAVKLIAGHVGLKTKFSIISKSLIRYEGLIKLLDPDAGLASLVCGKSPNSSFSFQKSA